MARMIGNNAATAAMASGLVGPGDTWHYDMLTDEIVIVSRSGVVRRIDARAFTNSWQQAQQNLQPSISGQGSILVSQAFAVTSSAWGMPPAPQHTPPHLKADPKQPDTLGWREWRWSDADECLESPSQHTKWPEAELVVPNWDEGDAVRGVSGIHAHLVPKHWKILCQQSGEYVQADDPVRVHGIVERFGKYVLGTEGWRAEWVVIKELMAPSTEVGLKIERAYPDVIVHYPEEEGEESWTSVKSSKWGKGSRPTSRPKPSPPPNPLPSPNSSPASPPSTQTTANPLANQLMPSQNMLQNANWSPSSLPVLSQQRLYGSLSSSESDKPKRDFVFNFLESGPIWVGGLFVAACLMWALS